MAEKSEQATPKKLRDARKKGQVAKSQDFSSAFTFVVSVTATLSLSGFLFNIFAGYIVKMFKLSAKNVDVPTLAPALVSEAIQLILSASIPILIPTACIGVLVSFLIVGPLFSLESMKPDIKRLNPVTNIKNMFKMKTLFELLKSIFKISGALILIYSVVWYSLSDIIASAALPVVGTLMIFSSFLIKVIVRVGIFFLTIAIFDLIFQKRTFAKEMKMEKFEVKQEYKDTEGDPHMKGRRRQVAQEIAYQEGPQSVRRAKAIITNPTHIAVAIEYNSETEPAPRIVTMGKDLVADMIMRIAQENGIPIMRNVTLARTLFEKGKISDYIPEETYQAVAEILRWIEGLGSLETSGQELFK